MLASNNVYSDDLIINSSATLEVAKSLGGKLTILNADLIIDQDANLSATDLQAVLDVIVTTTGNIQYEMVSKSSTPANFSKLSSAGAIYIDVAGDISFPELENVTDLHIGDSHASSITSFSAPKLAKVATFATGGSSTYSGGNVSITAGDVDHIDLSKATAITLSALATYDEGELEITGKNGFALDLAALTSKTAAGSSLSFDLTVNGAEEVNLPLFTKGSVDASNTDIINLPLFVGGSADDFTGAETITLGAYARTLTTGLNLETLDFTGAKAAGADDADDVGPSVVLSASTGVSSVTLGGVLNAVTANFTSDNKSIETFVLKGKANAVSISKAQGLEAITLEHTAEQALLASLSIVDNENIETLTVDALVSAASLTITGNDALATISFDALKTVGGKSTAAVTVNVSDNDLTATQAEQTNDTEDEEAGSFTSTSGMSDLKAYLTAAATRYAAVSTSSIYVAFDTLDSYLDIDDVQDDNAPFEWASQGTEPKLEVAHLSAGTFVAGDAASKAKRSWVIDATNGETIGITANGSSIAAQVVTNNTLAPSEILSTSALAAADAAGVTLSAVKGGNASVSIVFHALTSPTIGERYYNATRPATTVATSTFGLTASDTVTVVVGGQSFTVSKTAQTSSSTFADDVYDAYVAKFGSDDKLAKFSVTTDAGTGVTFTSRDMGTAGTGLSASVSASIVSSALNSMDWIIGTTQDSGDNKTTSSQFVITLEADTAGTLLSEIGKYGDTEGTGAKAALVSATAATELVATNDKVTKTDNHYSESRSDVVVPENAVSSTGTKNATNQISWL